MLLRRLILILVTSVIYNFCANAQNGLTVNNGAKSHGLGTISSTLIGTDAILNNFAGIIDNQSQFGFIVSSAQRFSLSELSSIAGGAAYKISNSGHLGLQFSSYGFEEYKEQSISIAYAKKISNRFNASVNLGYNTFRINEFGSSGILIYKIGAISLLTDELSIGFTVSNFENINIVAENPIVANLVLGIKYLISKKVTLYSDLNKDINEDIEFIAGIDYRLHRKFNLLFGINSGNRQLSMGFGYYIKQKLQVDTFLSYDTLLGITPGIGIKFINSQKVN